MSEKPTTTTPTGKCAVCAVDASLKCTACKLVFYCGVDHQKQHWKQHKTECQHSYDIAKSPELGRYVVAARDIPAKSVIFVEAPLVVGPKWSLEEFEKEVPVFPCVGCFQPVNHTSFKCLRCMWPVCSPDCQGLENPQLHGVECPILGTLKGPSDPNNLACVTDYYRSDALFALRSILLQIKYPQKWTQLLQLQSHDEERKGTRYYEEAETRIVSYLKTRFLDKIVAIEQNAGSKFLAECDAKTLHRVCGIIEVNALNINLENGQEISALYPTACLLEHSCVPNCMFTFDARKQFRITMVAGRDIKKGEHLSIMYTHMLWGTQMRHEHLMTNKYFVCKCVRCKDPTELGTYVSALKCIGDDMATCTGIMLPVDPHQADTEWTCSVCPVRLENEKVNFLLSNIEEEVDGLLLNKDTTVAEVESLIEKLRQFLHPNHYHLFALKHSLIQLYGNQKGFETSCLTESQLHRKIDMSQECLDLIDAIDPHAIRLSLYTGIVLYEMHSAVVELEKRRMAAAKEKGTIYNYDALYVAEQYLVRAKLVLENSGDTPQGKKFIESVVRASESLETLFEKIKL